MSLLGGIFETAVGGISSFFGGWQAKLAVVVLSIALGAFGGWRVTSWADSGTITALTAQRDAAMANAGTWKAASDQCQASVAALKKDADIRTAAANAALEKLRAGKVASDAKVAALLASKPKPGTSLCEAADALILETVQ